MAEKQVSDARIELISPTTQSCEICPLRRSIQSYEKLGVRYVFPLRQLETVNQATPDGGRALI